MKRWLLVPVLWVLAACAAAGILPRSAFSSSPSNPPSSPKAIKVVMDDNYPPYVFRDGNGRLQGILVDQWRLWEGKTGIRADVHAMDWGKALRRMEAGEFDVIDTIFRNESRERIYDFSKPYVSLEVPVFFHKNISGITDASSLKGFPVAVKNGDAAVDYLLARGVDRLVGYDSYEEIIRAAREHKIGVFVVDKPPAMYFLYKMGIHDQFRVSEPLYVGRFHRAVLEREQAAPCGGGRRLRPDLPGGTSGDRPEMARLGDIAPGVPAARDRRDPRLPGGDPAPGGLEPHPPEVGGAQDGRAEEGDDAHLGTGREAARLGGELPPARGKRGGRHRHRP